MIISKPANIQQTGIVFCKPALLFKECRAYIISPGTLKLRTRTLQPGPLTRVEDFKQTLEPTSWKDELTDQIISTKCTTEANCSISNCKVGEVTGS